MTPRQSKLVAASHAVDTAKRQIESDWPRSALDNPMLTPMQREIFAARQLDVAALDLAGADRHDRLVVRDELARVERGEQLVARRRLRERVPGRAGVNGRRVGYLERLLIPGE